MPSYHIDIIEIPQLQRDLLQGKLVCWFHEHRRDLPWRKCKDPYRVWISEIMLQQTQVVTVIPYFNRFVEQFPSLEALAKASLDEVLGAWKGLGYYTRARNLHRAARYLLDKYGTGFPTTLEAWLAVPGIGRYTAGAILSITFDQPVPVLDGNVARVYSRFFGRYEDPKSGLGQKLLWQLATCLVPKAQPGNYNESLMELGATLCTPAAPSCTACPLQTGCFAASIPDPTSLPVRSPTRKVPSVSALALFLRRPTDGAVLFGKRPASGLLGGLWELPTGVLFDNESLPDAASRVSKIRLETDFVPAGVTAQVQHTFSHFKLDLFVLGGELPAHCPLPSLLATNPNDVDRAARKPVGPASALEVPYTEWRWVQDNEILQLAVGNATSKALKVLLSTTDQLPLTF